MTLDQEDTEETIRNGLNGEAHKRDPLARARQTGDCLKAASTSLFNVGIREYPGLR